MILVDTSVYIEALADKELEEKLRGAGKKAFIISSEVIDDEIKEAVSFLRKTRRRDEAERLKEIYNSSTGGTIRLTHRVINIAGFYSHEITEKFGKNKSIEMKDDLRIVASASIAGLKYIATFNRKTMANEEIIEIYNKMNNANKLRTPIFINTKKALFDLLSSG